MLCGSIHLFIMIGSLIIIPIIAAIFFIVQYSKNKNKKFEEYLIPELEKYGFVLISSDFYIPKFMDFPFDTHEDDIIVNPIAGGFAMVPTHVHRHLRKVVFIDSTNQEYKVIAGIEFNDICSKKFKRLRFKPELAFFQREKRTTHNQANSADAKNLRG